MGENGNEVLDHGEREMGDPVDGHDVDVLDDLHAQVFAVELDAVDARVDGQDHPVAQLTTGVVTRAHPGADLHLPRYRRRGLLG